MSFQFEWDERKRISNIAKHGVDFYDAMMIFVADVLESIDDREDYGEERVIALGRFETEILQVVYTLRGQTIRIISAQKANRYDRQKYFSVLFHG